MKYLLQLNKLVYLLLLGIAIHSSTPLYSQSKIKKVKGQAPEFEMETFSGKIISSDELKGKVTLLEFWDTHCGPCRKLMPDFEKLTAKYANNDMVEIISVNGGFESKENAKKFIDKYQYNLFFTYMDKKYSRNKFKVRELPCTIIIDKNYNFHYMHLGIDEEKEPNIIEEFDRQIQEALTK